MDTHQKFSFAMLLPLLNEWHHINKEDIASVQQKILELTVKYFDALTGTLALLDKDGQYLTIVATLGLPSTAIGSRLSLSGSLLGEVVTSGTPLLLNGDVRQNHRYQKLALERESARPKSSICWPLSIGGETIGAISINRFEGAEPYNSADIENGTITIGLMALVFENSRLQCDQHRRISELSSLNEQLKAMNQELDAAQDQLMRSEKMASIGQLAAGVAHEINNPIGYVSSNLTSLHGYLDEIFNLLGAYERIEPLIPPNAPEVADLRFVKNVTDLAYLKEDVDSLLKECLEGVGRVRKIVQDLKTFSYDSPDWESADLHQEIDSALNIANNEIKYKATIIKNYAVVPKIECHPSQINQVMINILVNAAQAIKESGTISISTWCDEHFVRLEITDTGCGIAQCDLNRIFDPFYTTKRIGEGTGLGLSISYNIIKGHNGRIAVESEVGKGTKFTIWLPITQTHTNVPKLAPDRIQ